MENLIQLIKEAVKRLNNAEDTVAEEFGRELQISKVAEKLLSFIATPSITIYSIVENTQEYDNDGWSACKGTYIHGHKLTLDSAIAFRDRLLKGDVNTVRIAEGFGSQKFWDDYELYEIRPTVINGE